MDIRTETRKPDPQLQAFRRVVDDFNEGRPLDEDAIELLKQLTHDTDVSVAEPLDAGTLWDDLRNEDNDQGREEAQERIAKILQNARRRLQVGVELVDDWEAIEMTARDWLIPNWLPAGRIGMFSGKGGKGKTWLLLRMAAAMATGESEWLGRPDPQKQGPLAIAAGAVVFTSWEDEGTEFRRRLSMMEAAERKKGVHWADRDASRSLIERLKPEWNAEGKVIRGLRFLDLSRRGPVWGAPGRFEAARLLTSGEIVRRHCEEMGARLLILDSLGYAYGGNDSENEGVAQFLADWDGWGRDHNCAVLLVHHPPKPLADGKTHTGYRGASSWEMHTRWRWELGDGAGDNDTAKLSCEKASYAMRPDPVSLERSEKTGWAWRAANDQTPNPPVVGTDGQCQGKTQQGERCRAKATSNGYCRQHQAAANGTGRGARDEQAIARLGG